MFENRECKSRFIKKKIGSCDLRRPQAGVCRYRERKKKDVATKQGASNEPRIDVFGAVTKKIL
jgi:hypothetical protein